ncbi:MAG TPA: lipase family protein [Trebonia sp.]|nr:lipase family protein [Trebonia sp.]
MHVRVSRSHLLAVVAAALCAMSALMAGPQAANAATVTPPSQDPFYTYTGSTPLSQVAPGTVLKERGVSLSIDGLTVPVSTEQVLYRTTGELGQPTVTVTTIIKPLISLIGTKIVAYQTAYDALGSECDPSYTLQGGNSSDSTAQEEELAIAAYVLAGFTVTVPDYEGTSLDWGAGQESGYGTLDAIRATEGYLRASGSTEVGMVGYSGGAIATEWASELAPSYAPGLHIVGAAAGGVPVDFAHNLTYVNGDDDWSGVIPAVLVSLGRAFGVNITPYLSAYGQQLTSQVSGECIASFASSYPGLTIQQLLLPQYSNPFDVPVLVSILNHLIMGTSGGTPGEPLLLGVGDSDGTGDGIMIDGDVEALAHEYCQRGVPVTYTVYPLLPHADAAVPFEAQALTFLEGQFSGSPAPDGCASIGQGNSLAPLPQPAS